MTTDVTSACFGRCLRSDDHAPALGRCMNVPTSSIVLTLSGTCERALQSVHISFHDNVFTYARLPTAKPVVSLTTTTACQRKDTICLSTSSI